MGFCVLKSLKHTGSVPPKVETGTPPFDTEAGRNVNQQQHTGNTSQQEVDWDNYIFESRRRDVQGHDDEGGHTDDRHIGKHERYLRRRIRENKKMRAASSFTNEAAANLTQARFIKAYKKEIEAWLKSNSTGVFTNEITMDREIGSVITRRGKAKPTNKAQVVLAKDNSDLGYHAVTSYPIP